MSKTEYARHCGVSRQTVYDWVKKGDLVLSGQKVDLEATEAKRIKTSYESRWPHRKLDMTWGQALKWIQEHDGKTHAAQNIQARIDRITAAADELGYDVDSIGYNEEETTIAYFRAGEERHEFYENDSIDCAIDRLRYEIFYSAGLCPEEENYWSEAGLTALCLPAKELV
ncbi:DNA-binding protein [Serratia sp. M24T3]|uniref:DNA-binding protein n=1 Tax=Serratia sp. M24T3 TaxID=932213 RepID=UPI001ED91137|nr:DNA-binding protein [Serratia sp. M24T3]